MDDAYIKKGIKIINLDNLDYHFINIQYGEVKKEDTLSDLIKSLEKFNKFEPLFHNIKVEYFSEQKLRMLDYRRTGELYLCTYESTSFLNKNGIIIKKEVKLLENKFIKIMQLADFQKDFLDELEKGYKATGNFAVPSLLLSGAGIATTFFCPPLGIFLWAGGSVGSIYSGLGPLSGLISGGVIFIKNILNVKEINENKYQICYKLIDNEKDDYC